jgi:dTDP-4-amino-4,6-dideoxygalactose transaminase
LHDRWAKPVFADVDPESQNIAAETIAAALSKTKGIVVVSLCNYFLVAFRLSF